MGAKMIALNKVKGYNITKNMNWYCYILKCRDNSYYTGITNNLSKRLEKHNQSKGAKYTAAKKPVTLVWSRKFSSKIVALKKENEIKGWNRERKEKLIKNAGVAPSFVPISSELRTGK